MSIIFVFVGQCGNQVGAAVAKKLAANCATNSPSSQKFTSNQTLQQQQQHPLQQPTPYTGPFFGADGYLRSVLVDCEPKVVDAVVKSCAEQNIFIRPTNLVTGRSGRGNSWSLGYCGLPETDEAEVQAGAFRVSSGKDQLERDRTVLCRALKALHAETRRCDDGMIEAIVVLHSMAGGTGSGLGCALVENIRHHFCCNGNIHDDDFSGKTDEGDFHSVPLKRQGEHDDDDDDDDDSVAQFFMRRDSQHPKSARNKNKKSIGTKIPPPPSILHEDLIREGTYGEPRRARFVLSICVAPLVQGELAVQSINASLTLRTLVKNCDAVILLRNDCQKMFSQQHLADLASSRPGNSGRNPQHSNALANSFESMNQFFAGLLVSAFQGGNVFGCIGELLEASVLRVAGEDLDWEENEIEQQKQQQQKNRNQPTSTTLEFHQSDDEEHEERISKLLHPPSSSSVRHSSPPFGPRLLTVIPWEPRSSWTAAFRHSSVTATLVRPSVCSSSSSNSVGQQHDPQLLEAYLCNEVKGLESDLCSIIDREGFMNNLLRQSMKQQLPEKEKQGSNRSGIPIAKENDVTNEDRKILALVNSNTSGTSIGTRNNNDNTNNRPVLVLNQSSELTTSILFPFFKDAAAKVDSGAYMHAFNTRGILSQVFSATNNKKGKHSHNLNNSVNSRRVSPRRSMDSEKRNTEFARKFVNDALVDLLEYITETFPGM